MSVVTVGVDLQRLLKQFQEVTELRDESGDLLGVFTPQSEAERLLYEKASSLFDPKELDKRLELEHGKGRPLSEVLKRLESMEAKG